MDSTTSSIATAIADSSQNEETQPPPSAEELLESALAAYVPLGVTELAPYQRVIIEDPNYHYPNAQNLLFTAPTGSGKSMVAELLANVNVRLSGLKCLYVLPYIASAQEVFFNLQQAWRNFGLKVKAHYGATSYSPREDFDVLICTIEKAAAFVNRLLTENVMDRFCLMVIDEIHMVHDRDRGGLLEDLLVKIHYARCMGRTTPQIIAMSATLENPQRMAEFLDARLHQHTDRLNTLEEFAVMEKKLYKVGATEAFKRLDAQFDIKADKTGVLGLVIEQLAISRSVLVFCTTKACVEQTSHLIAQYIRYCAERQSDNRFPALNDLLAIAEECPQLQEKLRTIVKCGVAFHHSGLSSVERETVERLYRLGLIKVIVCTSTLSTGVNLPANRVIIRLDEGPLSSVNYVSYHQMIGRTGRLGVGDGQSYVVASNPKRLEEIWRCIAKRSGPSITRDYTQLILDCVVCKLAADADDCRRLLASTMHSQARQLEAIVADLEAKKFVYMKKLENEDNQPVAFRLTASQLGAAASQSFLRPDDALFIFAELEKAARNLCIQSELHMAYLVTPLKHKLGFDTSKIDWHNFFRIYERLPFENGHVAKLIGVTSRICVEAMAKGRAKDELIRFYLALILMDSIQGVSANEIQRKYGFARGELEALRDQAVVYARTVLGICDCLAWPYMKNVLALFAKKLELSVNPAGCDLMSLEGVDGTRARAFVERGILCAADLASMELRLIENLLRHAVPFSSDAVRGGDINEWLHNEWTDCDVAAVLLQLRAKELATGAPEADVVEEMKAATQNPTSTQLLNEEVVMVQTAAADRPNSPNPTSSGANAAQTAATEPNPATASDAGLSTSAGIAVEQIPDLQTVQPSTSAAIPTAAPKPPIPKPKQRKRRSTGEPIEPTRRPPPTSRIAQAIPQEEMDEFHRLGTQLDELEQWASMGAFEDEGSMGPRPPPAVPTKPTRKPTRPRRSLRLATAALTAAEALSSRMAAPSTSAGTVSPTADPMEGNMESALENEGLDSDEDPEQSTIAAVRRAESQQSRGAASAPKNPPKAKRSAKTPMDEWASRRSSLDNLANDLLELDRVLGRPAADENRTPKPKPAAPKTATTSADPKIEQSPCVAAFLRDADFVAFDFVADSFVLLHSDERRSLHIVCAADALCSSECRCSAARMLRSFAHSAAAPKYAKDLSRTLWSAFGHMRALLGSDLGDGPLFRHFHCLMTVIRMRLHKCPRAPDQLERLVKQWAKSLLPAAEAADRTADEVRLLRLSRLVRAALDHGAQPTEMETVFDLSATTSAQMTFRGVGFDSAECNRLLGYIAKEIVVAEREAWAVASERFDVHNCRQTRRILDKLHIPSSGKRTASIDDLRNLSHPVAAPVIRARKLAHANKFLRELRPQVHSDGRVHPLFDALNSYTGRIFADQPQIQFVPKEKYLDGKSCRAVFAAPPGHRLLSFDFKQVELRMLAALSKDGLLCGMLAKGGDPFEFAAQRVSALCRRKCDRDATKRIFYALLYGMGMKTLAADLKCSLEEANSVADEIFKCFRGVREWIDNVTRAAIRRGYVGAIWNLCVSVEGLNDYAVRQKAPHFAIQASVSELVRKTMNDVANLIPPELGGLILQMHDEFIVELREDRVDEFGPKIQSLMEHELVGVHFPVRMKVGANWSELE